jgi:nucleolar GTP-binding protein
MLENPTWKYDKVPEVMNGTNIVDYVDPEIEEKVR